MKGIDFYSNTTPVVVVGRSEKGVDFDAIDGAPAQLIFMLLTPSNDQGAQLQILADIARTFGDPEIRTAAFHALDHASLIKAFSSEPEKS